MYSIQFMKFKEDSFCSLEVMAQTEMQSKTYQRAITQQMRVTK